MTVSPLGVRVILVTNSLHGGGAEKQLLWIAKTLAETGVPTAVFELKAKPGNERLRGLIDATATAGVKFFRARPREPYLSSWLRLRGFARSHETAVVWTWGFRSDLAVLILCWTGIRSRWICSLRNANIEGLKRARRLIRACSRHVYIYGANTWANCEMLEEVCPGLISRCRVIYNHVPETESVPLALPLAVPSPLRVVMLGNIDIYRKGYDLIVELAEVLRGEKLPVEIHVAGRPDSGTWLDDQIKRRGLGQFLVYHGETGHPGRFLRTAHCFLLASRFEGMPNALLEAMAIAVPAIATRVGDLNRLVQDGRELRLVEVGDVAAMKCCIKEMLVDWPAAVAMGERGRRWCQANFDQSAFSRHLAGLMNAALKTE